MLKQHFDSLLGCSLTTKPTIKYKSIKPNKVIHSKNQSSADLLLEHLINAINLDVIIILFLETINWYVPANMVLRIQLLLKNKII